MLFSKQNCNFLAAFGCFFLIAIAIFYMERYLYLTACPLCYAQRIALGVIGFVFLLAAFFSGRRLSDLIFATILFFLSSCGAALSIRHVYLQSLPKDLSHSCGKDFYGLFESTPFADAIQTMILGSGECGDVQWTFLGYSIPAWTLVVFVCLGFWGLINNAFRR